MGKAKARTKIGGDEQATSTSDEKRHFTSETLDSEARSTEHTVCTKHTLAKGNICGNGQSVIGNRQSARASDRCKRHERCLKSDGTPGTNPGKAKTITKPSSTEHEAQKAQSTEHKAHTRYAQHKALQSCNTPEEKLKHETYTSCLCPVGPV